MDTWKWIAVLVVILVAILLLQQSIAPATQATPTPDAAITAVNGKTPGSPCEAGETASVSCNGNTLVFLECENSVLAVKNRNCGESSCANVNDIFACIQDVSGLIDATPTSGPGASIEPLLKSGYCGDAICSTKESCDSCAFDCACGVGEFCDTRYGAICRPAEACGDGICTDKETADSSCCQDCGCLTGDICPIDAGKCIEPLYLSESDYEPALQGRFPSGFTIVSSADYSIGGDAFKEVLVEDSTGILWIVYINAQAEIELEVSTT
ncbi:MAG: hypothetical protein V1834_03200 [Candidatus Micrarchaeota archaeon]